MLIACSCKARPLGLAEQMCFNVMAASGQRLFLDDCLSLQISLTRSQEFLLPADVPLVAEEKRIIVIIGPEGFQGLGKFREGLRCRV